MIFVLQLHAKINQNSKAVSGCRRTTFANANLRHSEIQNLLIYEYFEFLKPPTVSQLCTDANKIVQV